MRNVKFKSTVVLFFVAAGLCLNLIDCGLKSTQPAPEPEEDYIFYFNDASYFDKYYRYHSATHQVDSLIIPYESRKGFAVAADGSRLYLPDGNMTVVVSTDSFEVITEINYAGGVSVSPDGRFLAIPGYDISIIDTEDYSVVFHDTNDAASGAFSQNSQAFYCGNSPYVFKIDLSTPDYQITRTQLPYLDHSLRQVVPSVDESKWFLYRQDTINQVSYYFEVYNVALDSIIFTDTLVPGLGEIVVSPDGKYVFYTNPGEMYTSPSGPFTVFDVEKNKIHKTIEAHTPLHDGLPVGNLAITPDGRKLVAMGKRGTGEFVIIDVASMEQTEHYYLGQEDVNHVDLWNVICQNGPR